MTPTSATDLAREDAAWLAGLLDGEGCFDSPRGNPRIRVKMSDLDVVLRAADVMGATTHMEIDRTHPDVISRYGYTPRKPLMVAQLTGERAVGIMRAVLPWLGSRRTAKVTEIVLSHIQRKRHPLRVVRASVEPADLEGVA